MAVLVKFVVEGVDVFHLIGGGRDAGVIDDQDQESHCFFFRAVCLLSLEEVFI